MSRWTQHFAVGGASLAVSAGTLGAALWGSLAMVALGAVGVAGLVAIAALEVFTAWRDGRVTALEARLEAAEKAAEEAKKQANAALTSASSRPRVMPPPL